MIEVRNESKSVQESINVEAEMVQKQLKLVGDGGGISMEEEGRGR